MNAKATIHYHDIGDYLSHEKKLNIIKEYGSIANMQRDEHDTPRYIIDLLKRLVTLSLETRRIVKALPVLKL